MVARAPGFEEALLVVDVDPTAVIGRRLRDVRRRALARERRRRRRCDGAGRGRTGPRRRAAERRRRPVRRRARADAARARARARRLRRARTASATSSIGVSGGIDSALTAALAVEALGAERVHCVSMPSRYSSAGTRDDARRLAENLGCDFREIADRADRRGVRGRARGGVRRAASPTSPRRTCRRGSAARC